MVIMPLVEKELRRMGLKGIVVHSGLNSTIVPNLIKRTVRHCY
jgi:hypothetical protein